MILRQIGGPGEHAEIDVFGVIGVQEVGREADAAIHLAARRRTYERQPVHVLERRLAMALHPCQEQDQVLLAPGLIDDAAPQVRPYEAQHGADALSWGWRFWKNPRAVRLRIAAPQRLLDRDSRLAANPLDQRRLKADRQGFDRAL